MENFISAVLAYFTNPVERASVKVGVGAAFMTPRANILVGVNNHGFMLEVHLLTYYRFVKENTIDWFGKFVATLDDRQWDLEKIGPYSAVQFSTRFLNWGVMSPSSELLLPKFDLQFVFVGLPSIFEPPSLPLDANTYQRMFIFQQHYRHRNVMKIDDETVVTPLTESQQKEGMLFFLQDGIKLYIINSLVSDLCVLLVVGTATGILTICLKKIECTTKSMNVRNTIVLVRLLLGPSYLQAYLLVGVHVAINYARGKAWNYKTRAIRGLFQRLETSVDAKSVALVMDSPRMTSVVKNFICPLTGITAVSYSIIALHNLCRQGYTMTNATRLGLYFLASTLMYKQFSRWLTTNPPICDGTEN